MGNAGSDTYDAVIIGAGIGGLVCGCYLAKAGMKVLIAEQHHKPGGYCTSFRRKGFLFDAAAHSFGGYRKGGVVRKIITELGIDQKLNIDCFQPSDTVRTLDYTVSFWSDVEHTIAEFERAFPAERDRIRSFFTFLQSGSREDLIRLRVLTFLEFLNTFFTDAKLKAVLSLPLFGNGGLPPSRLSAFAGVKIFSEFLLDGGYYPEGGMQRLSDAFAQTFTESGGVLRLSADVQNILVNNCSVGGIRLASGEEFHAPRVISNCDARQTFHTLLGRPHVPDDFLHTLDGLVPSSSLFVAYLGIDQSFSALPLPGANIWFMPHYDLERAFEVSRQGTIDHNKEFMIRLSPDAKTLLAFVNVQYIGKSYWSAQKEDRLQALLSLVETRLIPGLSKHVMVREGASPHTLYRYTRNTNGAAYGWASTPSQFLMPHFRMPSFLKGLFLVGHWTTLAQGIPGVMYSGLETATKITKRRARTLSCH